MKHTKKAGGRRLGQKWFCGHGLALQLKDRENFLNNYLTPSIYAGWVEPLYPNQPKHPKQKYYLTEKGKALLTNGI